MFRITLVVWLILLVAGFSGCVSDREKLFETGRDARTFNLQTGQYEWQD